MARAKKIRRHGGGRMTPFRAGAIAAVILSAATFWGFTRFNPFADPYELNAVFATANNIKPRSPVRIAGVQVGEVKEVEALPGGKGAKVRMELKDSGLPIHSDATLKVRPRIFLEGNFFVDLKPGSPSASEVDTGGTIPIGQTAAPIQFGEVLTALQSDTREDLQVFLQEYAKGLEGKGSTGFNEALKNGGPAFRYASLANDATLGEEPNADLQRILRGQARTAAALSSDDAALKGLVTNLNVTLAAFASQDVALEASVPALRDTLRAAQPALLSLNNALPSVRGFARDALPGTISSDPVLTEGIPFMQQASALVGPRELQGAVRVLRRYTPSLTKLNRRSVPLLDEGRQLSACTNKVLVPFLSQRIPDPELPGNSNRTVRSKIQQSFPGLSGESRLSDGNNQYFHAGVALPGLYLRPAAPSDLGFQPPTHRPDIPCETQEPPNMNAPGGPVTEFSSGKGTAGNWGRRPSRDAAVKAILKAKDMLPAVEKAAAQQKLKALGKLKLTDADKKLRDKRLKAAGR